MVQCRIRPQGVRFDGPAMGGGGWFGCHPPPSFGPSNTPQCHHGPLWSLCSDSRIDDAVPEGIDCVSGGQGQDVDRTSSQHDVQWYVQISSNATVSFHRQ